MIGDLCHLAAILILLYQIHASGSCQGLFTRSLSQSSPIEICLGISLKTQALYAMVFITRYTSTHYVSLYNSCGKVFFSASSLYILYLMQFRFRSVPLFPSHLPCIHALPSFTCPFPVAQHSTHHLTPSALNTSSSPVPSLPSSSPINTPLKRFSGPSPSSSNPYPSSPSSPSSYTQVMQTTTSTSSSISPCLAHTGHCISRIGPIGGQ
jgi:hypothetical protein